MKNLLCLFLLISSSTFSQYEGNQYEHILSYHSDIEVLTSCEVVIKENIKVYSDGNKIKRGIYRDLPLSYAYKGGNVHVGFELLDIKRDGKKEPHHTKWQNNGIRIYIGSEDVQLQSGYYTYSITYKVDHVLGLFDTYDEIYWNVNGNGWDFDIDSISATIHLPKGAHLLKQDGYVGLFGSKNKTFVTKVDKDNRTIFYSSINSLGPSENLTIAVAWDKGHLTYPTFLQNVWFWIRSYLLWVIGIIGVLSVLIYNTAVWYKYGRDPKPGTIIPLFYAPEDFSPAECIYLKKAGASDKVMFGSQLIGLATKGYITLEVKNESSDEPIYYVTKNEDSTSNESLNDIEKLFLSLLFGQKGLLIIAQKYNARVAIALEKMTSAIDEKQDKKYFIRNTHLKAKQFILPVLFLILGFVSYYIQGGFIGIIFISFILMIAANVIYAKLYEQPTAEGRKKMDEIAGFEMYLKYAEKLQIKALNPPTMDFTYFEKNLPYAMALGVADEWKNQFDVTVIKEGYTNHSPYLLGVTAASMTHFSDNISSTISSASTPPGSGGGGSGGGGFSGGGGGGGGGGGW